jgi:hypothetical protein
MNLYAIRVTHKPLNSREHLRRYGYIMVRAAGGDARDGIELLAIQTHQLDAWKVFHLPLHAPVRVEIRCQETARVEFTTSQEGAAPGVSVAAPATSSGPWAFEVTRAGGVVRGGAEHGGSA